jgi:3-phosphoshikimate 1-carboxyvinyltransferase
VTTATITPGRPLQGRIAVPGDKSITHRAVILGSVARGETVVRGYLASEDCARTIAAFRAMGRPIEETAGQRPMLRIRGEGLSALREAGDVIDCGNSGTTIRLLAGLLAARPMFSVLTGDASLRRRPMLRVVDPLRTMGARITGREDGRYAPLAIAGRALKGTATRLPVASAQVKSALLLAGLAAEGRTTVTEPHPSRDHTERMLSAFGAPVTVEGPAVSIDGPSELVATEVDVPGDFSSAAFFIVAALIVPGSELVIEGVGVNPTRTGLLDALRAMGASIGLERFREVSGEPVADLVVRATPLRGATINGALVPRTIDEFPILCVAAALADGETVIDDAQELRVKESDRLTVMTEELGRLGVAIEERPAGLRIVGPQRINGGRGRSHGDHRAAMALAVAGLVAQDETTIEDVECVGTSFPGFFELLERFRR